MRLLPGFALAVALTTAAHVHPMSAVTGAGLGAISGGNTLYGGIVNGQSLSVGFGSSCGSAISTSQVGGNLQLLDSSGNYTTSDPSASTLSLGPLFAPLHSNAPGTCSGPLIYPSNQYNESAGVGAANELYTLNGRQYAVTGVGLSGIGYAGITKGTASVCVAPSTVCNAYAASIYEVTAITRLANLRNLKYRTDWLYIVHGEGDAQSIPPVYENDLVQLQGYYQGDIPAITGQGAATIPMFLTQQNGDIGPPLFVAGSPQSQWRTEFDYPGTFWCVGPKYQYPYVTSGVHLQNSGYLWADEKVGEDIYRVQNGLSSTLLAPTAATVTGTTITETLKVPVAPLQWYSSSVGPHQSPTLLSNVWSAGKGYEAYDATGATITIATNTSPIVITETGYVIPSGGIYAGVMYATTAFAFVIGNYHCTYISASSCSLDGSTAPGAGYGFPITGYPEITVYLPITSVTISGSTVQIALGTSTWNHLGIAYGSVSDTDHPTNTFGFQYAGGLLEDSDPFVGRSGHAQSNFLVANWMQIN